MRTKTEEGRLAAARVMDAAGLRVSQHDHQREVEALLKVIKRLVIEVPRCKCEHPECRQNATLGVAAQVVAQYDEAWK